MKKTVLNFIMILGVLIFSITLHAQEFDFDPNKLKAEYFNDKGVKDGLVFNDKKGNTFKIKNNDYSRGLYIKHEGKWLKHGVYYEMSSGRVTSKTLFVYGEKNGEYLAYHSNGNLNFRYHFNKGIKEGKWYQYRDDGSPFEEKEFKNGVIEGTKISYHPNGLKEYVSTYVNGKRHGETLGYNKEGKLISGTKYNMGEKVGKTQWYY